MLLLIGFSKKSVGIMKSKLIQGTYEFPFYIYLTIVDFLLFIY